MASTSETGHAKNVANFDELTSFVSGYGANYNPSKPSIQLSELQVLAFNAKKAMDQISEIVPNFTNAVAARDLAFKPMNKLATRVINALDATDTPEQVVDNVRTIIRKLNGARASSSKTGEAIQPTTETENQSKEISVSQMSYDNRIENFYKLIQLLSHQELYHPNETDITIDALVSYHADLKTKNNSVIQAATPLSNARITRNEILYAPKTGLVDVALDVKKYIKSLFGADSPKYKQVSKLNFRTAND